MLNFAPMMGTEGGKTGGMNASPSSSNSPSNFNIQGSPQSSSKPFDMKTFMDGLNQHMQNFKQPVTGLQDSYKKMMGGFGIGSTTPIPQLNMQQQQMQSQNFVNPQQNQQVLQNYFNQRGR